MHAESGARVDEMEARAAHMQHLSRSHEHSGALACIFVGGLNGIELPSEATETGVHCALGRKLQAVRETLTNTTSKLGLPSHTLLRNQHGETRDTRQTKHESATTRRESNTHATKPTRPQ